MGLFGYSKLTRDQAKLFIIDCYMGVLKRYPEKEVLEKCSFDISAGKITCGEFLSNIVCSKEFRNIEGGNTFSDLSKSYADFSFKNINLPFHLKKIVYLGFAVNRPIGGMKVIMRHAEIINTLFKDQIESCILFPENSLFKLTWLESNVDTKRDHLINLAEDLIVVPEMWALSYGSLLKDAGVRYGIFVQNGYLLFNELMDVNKLKMVNLSAVYNNASVILSISDDVSRCVNSFFPKVKNRLIQVATSINKELFASAEAKENIITYMPRKLPTHSAWVVHQLMNRLPENWSLVRVNNVTENEVAQLLGKSKIFLSFSDQEGLGLPPLEAAFAGNKVIGYTGQAGKEYWNSSIFIEIECGDLLRFVDIVLEEVNTLNSGSAASVYPNFSSDLENLKNKYSKENETASIKNLIDFVSSIRE